MAALHGAAPSALRSTALTRAAAAAVAAAVVAGPAGVIESGKLAVAANPDIVQPPPGAQSWQWVGSNSFTRISVDGTGTMTVVASASAVLGKAPATSDVTAAEVGICVQKDGGEIDFGSLARIVEPPTSLTGTDGAFQRTTAVTRYFDIVRGAEYTIGMCIKVLRGRFNANGVVQGYVLVF
jgi:hypothetical protein